MHRLRVRDLFRQAAIHDGEFGRGQLYIDVGTSEDTPEQATPLVLSTRKIGKGKLLGFRAIEPVWTYPSAYQASDPLRPDYYVPQAWYVNGRKIHASRLLTFIGRPLPDLLKPAYNFSGLSLSQMAKPYIDNWLRTRQSVSDLVQSFSIVGLKTDMSALLAAGGSEQMAMRAELFNAIRDNRGLFMLDKGSANSSPEEFFNVVIPLGGLDHLQAQAQEQQSAVSGIPLVVLLGITPSGLNASSDGEMRAWENTVHAEQEGLFRGPIEHVVKCVQLSLFGAIDPNIRIRFEPLLTPSEQEQVAIEKMKADLHAVNIGQGIVSAEEAREATAADENSLYHGIDLSGPPPPPPQTPEEAQGLLDGPDDDESNEQADAPSGKPDNPAENLNRAAEKTAAI